ncbi:transmembrane protein 182-like [Notolabrus celidotus]|uniref:transmembrane protein 182-like n=1 Tax=Notolabrus celidotus TaxID=1203425 RepID=UPI00148FA7F0|nr:transmembrane protein 182-like [Notolabrus celidotus]XP_034533749.1 transmembrane protein 182-like [Notolabrus celidotus]
MPRRYFYSCDFFFFLSSVFIFGVDAVVLFQSVTEPLSHEDTSYFLFTGQCVGALLSTSSSLCAHVYFEVLEHAACGGACEESLRRVKVRDMTAERLKVLVFLALFFGASGILFTLLSCGTEYWLLASESCRQRSDKAPDWVRVFHEGLFWRCSFSTPSEDFSTWDLWISNQPSSKLCQAAFLFPFPVYEPSWAEPHGLPSEAYEHSSAIVFRTFWSIFLIVGLMSVVTGGFVVVCAGPLANHRIYKVGGALQLSGGVCLLAVALMYLMWVQVLDTLEQFVLHQRVSSCPSFHLSIQHGPSFLLAPVAVFSCLLAGLLSLLVGRSIEDVQRDKKEETQEAPASDV